MSLFRKGVRLLAGKAAQRSGSCGDLTRTQGDLPERDALEPSDGGRGLRDPQGSRSCEPTKAELLAQLQALMAQLQGEIG